VQDNMRKIMLRRWLVRILPIFILVGLITFTLIPERMSISAQPNYLSLDIEKGITQSNAPTTAINSPTTNTGSVWTNPTYAYADDSLRTTITAGNPSGSNIWGGYGFNLTGNVVQSVRVRYDAYSAALGNITFRATGAVNYGTTSAISPALPTGLVNNDVCILVASTIAGGSITITANGSIGTWTPISGSPINVTGGEKLYVWWGRYSSGSTAPSLQAGSDHIVARITSYYNVSTDANPIDVAATGTEATSDTSFSFATGLTTTANNEMCIAVCSTGYDVNSTAMFSTMANTSLTSLAERMDNVRNSGGGGGFGMAQGFKATAGTMGTFTSTLTYASPKAYIAFALKQATYPQIKVDVSCDGGTVWTSSQNTTLTASEVTYWYDVTSLAVWMPSKLTDVNFKVRALVQTQGNSTSISLDWLAVEVIYTPPDLPANLQDGIYYTGTEKSLQYVDNSWEASVTPWDWQMIHDDYQVRVKNNIQDGQVIEFAREGETVYLQPSNLQWTNDLGQIQLISTPANISALVGTEATELVAGVTNNEGYINWNDTYGAGINFKWQCTPKKLAKVLEIESLSNLTLPESYIIDGGNPKLELNLIFAPSKNLEIYADNVLWNQTTKVQTFGSVSFVKDGKELWRFNPLQYWCADNGLRDGESVATLDINGGNLYISIQVPYSWLQSAVYPVYIDADIAIETAALTTANLTASRAGPFWKSTTVGYVFYLNTSYNLVYRKTTDGGANWGAATSVVAHAIMYFDCWADWQTAGDTGTKTHIAYVDTDNDDIRYIYLETATDTVGGEDQITTPGKAISPTVGIDISMLSITKTRGGNITVASHYYCEDMTNQYNFSTSPDGDTWTSRTSPWENADDYIQLYPGNEADTNDLWAAFWDTSANAISLKIFDDSANSWGETAIGSATESLTYLQMDGQIRLSDGHLIFAYWNITDNAAADLQVWDINGAASITAKTNVITDEAESATVSVFINQVNDDLYITYCSGSAWAATVQVFYQKSTDGGANWGGETAMMADAEEDIRWVSAGCMKATLGGKFQPVWFDDDDNDLFTNTTNGVSIAAAASYDIAVSLASEALGFVAASSTYYAKGVAPADPDAVIADDCTFELTNSGATHIDVDVHGHAFTGGVGWTLTSDAPGSNTVRITVYHAGDDVSVNGIILATASPGDEFISDLGEGANIKLDFMLETGTFTDGELKTGIVTFTARAVS
jgi:hypothetical protein